MRILYVRKRFSEASHAVIEQANAIIEEYAAQGFDLTLRQLYYQFVARSLIANTERDYKRIGSIISDGRLAGLIDWEAISDRTRNLQVLSHWASPDEIVEDTITSYHLDYWANQEYRPEVWIEKDALIGVIEDVCDRWDVPFFSCRGYTSQSEMWGAGQRLIRNAGNQTPVIFHFGDHDPSGIDMTRDIVDRLELFTDRTLRLERLALNIDQVRQYNPPPNPTKLSDSRAGQYVRIHGNESWELDALEPRVLAALVSGAVESLINQRRWNETNAEEKRGKEMLRTAAASLKNNA